MSCIPGRSPRAETNWFRSPHICALTVTNLFEPRHLPVTEEGKRNKNAEWYIVCIYNCVIVISHLGSTWSLVVMTWYSWATDPLAWSAGKATEPPLLTIQCLVLERRSAPGLCEEKCSHIIGLSASAPAYSLHTYIVHGSTSSLIVHLPRPASVLFFHFYLAPK